MAITSADFVATYPEFDEINDVAPASVSKALLRAQAFCSASIWVDRYEAGVFAKAAHLLAMTPFGENARIDAKQVTAYGVVFDEMVRALPIRLMVSGGFGGILGA